MKINLIIGAGQLGSRHLQGLLKYKNAQTIYVLDPFKESLETARQRAGEVEHQHKVVYLSNWNDLPPHFDLVIISTNAGIRDVVTKTLLEKHTVQFLILEKVLFQKLQSYDEIKSLLSKNDVRVWVNHPRRMGSHYQEIKQIISSTESEITLHTYGVNWGLACNGIHFVDLFSFLANSYVSTLDAEWIDSSIQESKRAGCVEFTGTLKGTLQDGSRFMITSASKGSSGTASIYISAGANRWIVSEGAVNQIVFFEQDSKGIMMDYNPEYQSSLTTRLAEQLFQTGQCDLPTYKDAYQSHVPYIQVLLEKYNQLTGLNSDTCPIT